MGHSLASFLLFLRTLSRLEYPVFYTHTLSLAAIRASIYTKLPPKWLSDILTKLPSLQALILTGFPFVDHASLTAVGGPPHRVLQTLIAQDCENSTSVGIRTLLQRLPGLRVLDLSGRTGAGDPGALKAIAELRDLHTLSLRDLQLEDAVFSALPRALGARLRSLDIRSNLLTDTTAALLLDYCFAPPSYAPTPVTEEEGLTHLRISNNALTTSGAIALIKSTRLITLDLDTPKGPAENMVPALSMYSHSTLRTLRITHRAVTSHRGLRRRMLPRLKTLVLSRVPEWASKEEAESLVEFISTPRAVEGDVLEVLELEMAATGDYEDEGCGGVLEGEFSFFNDGSAEEGGSSWAGRGERASVRVEMLKEVKRARERKDGWEGRIRVLRDLAGRESKEMGVEGERWGLVREKV